MGRLVPVAHVPSILLLLGLATLACTNSRAQELAPRAYWPAPVGTQGVLISYLGTRGDIVVDQSLPVSDVSSSLDGVQLAYQRFDDWFGRTASLQLNQASARNYTEGIVEGERRVRDVSGLMDTQVRAAINLYGAPAMDREGFMALRRNPGPLIGASLTVTAPTGDYDNDRIINLGTNRWQLRPAFGAIVPVTDTVLFEAEAAVWWFQDNDDFIGTTREQDPVFSLQAHFIKRFAPGYWISANATYYNGGRSSVDGGPSRGLQQNTRLGITGVFPLTKGRAIRASFSDGVSVNTGGDYRQISISFVQGF